MLTEQQKTQIKIKAKLAYSNFKATGGRHAFVQYLEAVALCVRHNIKNDGWLDTSMIAKTEEFTK